MFLKKKTFRTALILVMTLMLALPAFTYATGFDAPEGKTLTTLKEFNVAPGITEQHITTVHSDGSNQSKSYAVTIDLTKNTGILASYKDYDDSGKWGMQTVRDQAAAAEKQTGKKIVAAVNGDYFNMNTGEPLGALVMGGKVVHEANGEPYFAILNDGTPVLRDANVPFTDVAQAVSGPFFLMRDGKIEEWIKGDAGIMPRCAVGITAEGKVVLLTIDGRQAPTSVGMTLYETAQMLEKLDCVDAIYLDGGGSATFATRSEGEDALSVKNSPSDGVERSVSSSLLVYSDAKPSGVFDHAVLAPQAEVYTPGSAVEFTATGVDSAGEAVSLPKDGKFTLADASMGTIDANSGAFKSSGKTGEVIVKYESEGKVKGSTSIEIQQPDKITFINTELSLDFGQETDLGLYVTYKDRVIHYNDDDFVWSMSDEKMGSFKGNLFMALTEETMVQGTITCKYKDSDVKGDVSVIIGMEPVVVMDFEDYIAADGTVTPAADYWTFNRVTFDATTSKTVSVWDEAGNPLSAPNSKLVYGSYTGAGPLGNRGGNESAEIVSKDDDYPVRFGEHSLKLNYDFTNNNNSTDPASIITDGACVGFAEATQQIPGSPTGIGMYVYAPDGTANLWMRMRVRCGDSENPTTVNFMPMTSEGGQNGIHWTGWKYMYADLSNLQGPFSLIAGEAIRPMYLKGYGNLTNTGEELPKSQCKGSIYIDNLQFVYGTNTADVDNPVVGNIMANGAVLEEDAVLTTNTVSLQAMVADVENKYTSGIDYSTISTKVYIDGEDVTGSDAYAYDASQDSLYVYNYKLANGDHSVRVVVLDNEGNEGSKTVHFTVNTEEVDMPSVSSGFATDEAVLGEYADINIKASELANLSDLTATVKLGKDYTDYKVTYAEGYEQAAEPVYNARQNTVTIYAKKTEGAVVTGAGNIASIAVLVPDTMTAQDSVNYSITSGKFTVTGEGDAVAKGTFVTKNKKVGITAKYRLEADRMIAGFDAKIYAYDKNNKLVRDITIFTADGEEIGSTGLDGTLTTSKFRKAQQVKIYGQDAEGKKSFVYQTYSYDTGANADGTPTFVTVNPVKNSDTEKNFTWQSKPGECKKAAVAKVALKSEFEAKGEAAYKEYKGTTELVTFDTRVTYANEVQIDGLKPDSEYVYVVGDGEKWSEQESFETLYDGQDMEILLIGDTQATSEEGKTQIKNVITKAVEGKTYDLAIQTGDFVESGNSYNDWADILGAFDGEYFNGTDMIHVTGNHELYGDDDGSITTKLFGLESLDHYSVTYGNVYVASLGYASGETLAKSNADWLAADAAKSDAKWKIVVLHQPPYGTNATDNSCDNVHKYLPAACDAAGIDFVFSGHDHAYARTEPMIGGEVNKDGTVYFVSGSTGEKSYAVTVKPEYNLVKATNDYAGLYLNIETTDTEFKVTAYEADGSVFDTYTKTKKSCSVHSYEVTENNHLVCADCKHARRIGEYTGLVTDQKTGDVRYLKSGAFVKNEWVIKDTDNYYMNSNGYAEKGTVVIKNNNGTDVEYTFNKDGVCIGGSFVKETVTNPKTGEKTEITRYYEAGGKIAVHWHEIGGNMYYFRKNSNNENVWNLGEMYTGDGVKARKVNAVGNAADRSFVFGPDGKLVLGAFEIENVEGIDKLRYYWGDDYVTGTHNIQDFDYSFDEKTGLMDIKSIKELNVSSVDEKYEYTGNAIKPEVTVTDGEQTLVNGTHYNVKYSSNKKCGTAKITITGIEKRGYTGTTTITFKIRPGKSTAKVKNVTFNKQKITWTEVTGATKYNIFRSVDGKKFTFIKSVNAAEDRIFYSKNLKTGKTYYYKVTAVRIQGKDDNAVKFYGSPSEIVKAKPVLYKGTVVSVKNTAAKTATIKWKKVNGASGYLVYRSTTNKVGSFKIIKTVKNGNTVTFKNTKLIKGKTYYYKVKPFRVVDGKRVFGKLSTSKGVKIAK